MRFESLDDWLAWQETLNPKGIELGLERVRAVLARLDLLSSDNMKPPYQVVTVAGTNGKGSCAAYCEAMLRASSRKTGRYLSPHVSRYNERIAIDGRDIDDAALCAAFEEVDRARGDTALTYFEFGTLAALVVFRNALVDVAVLEVGLGGRLDAVNAIDADVAVVVSVALDHMDWLGDDLDGIAREKAGIFRPGRPAIFGAGPAPRGLLEHAGERKIPVAVGGEAYWKVSGHSRWTWENADRTIRNIPLPFLPGAHQLDNAAAAIAATVALQPEISDDAVREGIASARIPGRLERISDKPEVILDVGHNPAAAEAVGRFLGVHSKPTVCLLAMLADKDAAAYIRALQGEVDSWLFAGLAGPRGQTGENLKEQAAAAGLHVAATSHETVAAALDSIRDRLAPEDRLLIAGSFHTVGEAVASGVYSWQHDRR